MKITMKWCPEHGQPNFPLASMPDLCPVCGRALEQGVFQLEGMATEASVYVGLTPLESVLAAHALKLAWADRDDAVLKSALDKIEDANAAVLDRKPDLRESLEAQIELMRLGD